MKFGRKLFLLVFAAVAAATLVSLLYFNLEAFNTVRNIYRAKALSIVATGAPQVNGDLLEPVVREGTENSDGYRELATELRRIRDLNRREDTYVKFVYLLVPDKQDHNVIRFAVDPEEVPKDHSGLGEVFHKVGEPVRLGEQYADRTVSSDQWGEWLSAYTPIRNSKGTVVGALAVDIPATRLSALSNQLLRELAISLGIGLLIAWVASLFLSTTVSRPLSALQKAVQEIGKGNFAARAPVKSHDEFGEVAASLNQMSVALAERDQIKTAFARYVSQQVMDDILAAGAVPSAGHRRRITVMFSDIRGFTSLSEKLNPEQVVELLNEYFETMVDIVFKYQGTLDKFLGDGLMIIFGAPNDDPFQEEHAVAAALEMRRAINLLSRRWQADHGITLKIGIGIHSGNAVVGSIGSSKRMEYTAIGDTVNLASRLEAATKEHGVDILMSEYTYHSVRGVFEVRPLGALNVRGREEAVGTYTVIEKVEVSARGPASSQPHQL